MNLIKLSFMEKIFTDRYYQATKFGYGEEMSKMIFGWFYHSFTPKEKQSIYSYLLSKEKYEILALIKKAENRPPDYFPKGFYRSLLESSQRWPFKNNY